MRGSLKCSQSVAFRESFHETAAFFSADDNRWSASSLMWDGVVVVPLDFEELSLSLPLGADEDCDDHRLHGIVELMT